MKPPPPTGTEASVCDDIASRQQLGRQKYGTTVSDNPLSLSQWLQHAYEETLDQAIYLKRAIAEIKNENELNDAEGVESECLLADCDCKTWCSDRRELDNEHHHRCEQWVASPRPSLQHAVFGRLMWEYLTTKFPDFLGDDWSLDIMPIAEKSGLCVWTRYIPEIHGEIEAEEGTMIWYWGDCDSSANAEVHLPMTEDQPTQPTKL